MKKRLILFIALVLLLLPVVYGARTCVICNSDGSQVMQYTECSSLHTCDWCVTNNKYSSSSLVATCDINACQKCKSVTGNDKCVSECSTSQKCEGGACCKDIGHACSSSSPCCGYGGTVNCVGGYCRQCGDNTCSSGENCPADASGCSSTYDTKCHDKTCTSGCGKAPIAAGPDPGKCEGTTGCTGNNCACDGNGGCKAGMAACKTVNQECSTTELCCTGSGLTCTGGKCCKPSGTACAAGECCTGLTCDASGKCATPTTACKNYGESCDATNICCAASGLPCTDGKCCKPSGATCTAGQCCTGLTCDASGKCATQTTCKAYGETGCNTIPCCTGASLTCINNLCTSTSGCKVANQYTPNSAECCTGLVWTETDKKCCKPNEASCSAKAECCPGFDCIGGKCTCICPVNKNPGDLRCLDRSWSSPAGPDEIQECKIQNNICYWYTKFTCTMDQDCTDATMQCINKPACPYCCPSGKTCSSSATGTGCTSGTCCTDATSCKTPTTCKTSGQSCTATTECCTGLTCDTICKTPTTTCPNNKCDTGENCPADASACTDNKCYEPTCTNGCGQTAVTNGQTDEACTGTTGCTGGNCKCDGSGNCVGTTCKNAGENCYKAADCCIDYCSEGHCNSTPTCLSEIGIVACKAADEAGTCDKLEALGFFTKAQCCSCLGFCCPPQTCKTAGQSCTATTECCTGLTCDSTTSKCSTTGNIVQLSELRLVLLDTITAYFTPDKILTKEEIKDLIVAYFAAPIGSTTVDLSSNGQHSGKKLIETFKKGKAKGKTIPDPAPDASCPSGQTFKDLQSLGGKVGVEPAVEALSDGTLIVMVKGYSDNTIYAKEWKNNVVVKEWYTPTGATQEKAKLVKKDGELWAYVKGTDGNVYKNKYQSTGSWKGWETTGLTNDKFGQAGPSAVTTTSGTYKVTAQIGQAVMLQSCQA